MVLGKIIATSVLSIITIAGIQTGVSTDGYGYAVATIALIGAILINSLHTNDLGEPIHVKCENGSIENFANCEVSEK